MSATATKEALTTGRPADHLAPSLPGGSLRRRYLILGTAGSGPEGSLGRVLEGDACLRSSRSSSEALISLSPCGLRRWPEPCAMYFSAQHKPLDASRFRASPCSRPHDC